ncbi:MAG: Maf family protein [Candidatus Acidiferrales bacterium]
MVDVVLASASPRRAEILRNAGIEFTVFNADVDETRHANESADAYVSRVAAAKAEKAAAYLLRTNQEAVTVAADTVVVVGDEVLGKPVDAADAKRMLRLLSGKAHEVRTGLAIIADPAQVPGVQVVSTRVHFATMTDAEIDAYLSTGEPFDKAGAYGIQGIGGKFVTGIEGCYFNVMGLPLSRVWSALTAIEKMFEQREKFRSQHGAGD